MSDAKLTRDCLAFIEAYRRLTEAARDENEAGYETAAIEVDRLADRIAATAPTTLSGIRAKARAAVLLWAGPGDDFPGDDETTAIARSLLTDLAAMPDDTSVATFDPSRRVAAIGSRKDWR